MLREERKKEGIYLKDFSGRKERQKMITPRWESYFFVIKRKDAYYVLLRLEDYFVFFVVVAVLSLLNLNPYFECAPVL
jgi:hypothetical protein